MSAHLPATGTLLLLLISTSQAAENGATFDREQASIFLRDYCLDCHGPSNAEAKLDLSLLVESPTANQEGLTEKAALWHQIWLRVKNKEMPPTDATLPEPPERSAFTEWVYQELHQQLCAGGIIPSPPRMRRMNRSEYAGTMRDLLGIQIDAGASLPDDGAGGEGFDNAVETLFISPIHAEKYLDSARNALQYAFADSRTAEQLLIAEPANDLPDSTAAAKVLEAFLLRAFRKPVENAELMHYLGLFNTLYEIEPDYRDAVRQTMEAILISPQFLFLIETPVQSEQPVLLSDYELASRLSYFLWNSMPDERLFELAAKGELSDETVLVGELQRMLGGGDPPEDDKRQRSRRRRDDRVRYFAQNFVEQWLGTRALGRTVIPDPSVGSFDSELEGGMKYEPVFFLDYVLSQNRSLLELLDSDYTFVHRRLARHYGIEGDFREQPRLTELPEGSHRGGLLGMAAVLCVSSYPHRTSPVLRGKWILETLLGTPPPPAPPNVPPLPESGQAQSASSLRQRLELHRQNPACAACHNRIDPLGFGLENYDVLGRWRTEDSQGNSIDSRGELPDGTSFSGPEELKQLLLDHKDDFIRHITKKMLGYALGRSLSLEDTCAVEHIVQRVKSENYASHSLIFGIVQSPSFRYKAGTLPAARVPLEAPSLSVTQN
ncbi:MAG: DUF1588 domain-containing protein [Planctomycetales bacterium]|nr:DUF1588 domain-containing protein [Planctomycetales bacterium]